MTTETRHEFTTRRIARWLRCYLDWQAELEAGPRSRSVTDYSRPVVMGGADESGGDGLAYVQRQQDLRRQVETVDQWLSALSPLERQAADYWLQDEDGTIGEVALAAGLEYQQARRLVHAIPLIIWGRFYHQSTDGQQKA